MEPDAISVTEGVNGYVFVRADGSVWQTNSVAAVQIAPPGTNPTDIMASTLNPNGVNAGYYIANGTLYGGGAVAETGRTRAIVPALLIVNAIALAATAISLLARPRPPR